MRFPRDTQPATWTQNNDDRTALMALRLSRNGEACETPRALNTALGDGAARRRGLDPLHVLPAFKKMRARLKDPECTPELFAAAMERNGLTQTAAYLRQASELI